MTIKHYTESFEDLEKFKIKKGEEAIAPSPQEEMVEVKDLKGKSFFLNKKEFDRINNFSYEKLNAKERAEYVNAKKAEIKKFTRPDSCPEWTPEQRQKQKELFNTYEAKQKAELNWKNKRRMTRYLKDTITGRVYAWTEYYAQMERMKDLGWHDPLHEDITKL